jgi:hypothetical protein
MRKSTLWKQITDFNIKASDIAITELSSFYLFIYLLVEGVGEYQPLHQDLTCYSCTP